MSYSGAGARDLLNFGLWDALALSGPSANVSLYSNPIASTTYWGLPSMWSPAVRLGLHHYL